MRIVGYIEDPSLKITLFQYDGRFSVQLETPHYAQIFKIRQGQGAESVEDIYKLIDATFIEEVKLRFQSMHMQFMSCMNGIQEKHQEDDWEEII
jgi:hypothetical protein